MRQFWFYFLTTMTVVAVVSSTEEVLDNTAAQNQNWNWIIKDPPLPFGASGWERLGTTPPRYRACDAYLTLSDPQPNYWLLSDQIALRDANRIDIVVKYFITSCLGLNGGPYCVHVFDLYVYQSDQFIADLSLYPDPLINSVAYEKVAEIKQATNKITSETISILVTGKYVILAFHNNGSCSTLFSVKVTYNVCPDETLGSSLISLPRTVAPANDSQPIRVEGKCIKDAVQVSGSLFVHCESIGEWNTTGIEGKCICKEDMENNGRTCEACPDGKYNDQMGFNCTVLPTIPRNITVTFVNQSAVELRWLPPEKTGDRTHVVYDVDCRKPCDSQDDDECVDKECGNDVTYVPYKEGLNMAQVMVTSLSTFVNYTFKIYGKNRVSEVAKRRHGVEGNFSTITVRTNGSSTNSGGSGGNQTPAPTAPTAPGHCEDKLTTSCQPYKDSGYCATYPDSTKYWCEKTCFNCQV